MESKKKKILMVAVAGAVIGSITYLYFKNKKANEAASPANPASSASSSPRATLPIAQSFIKPLVIPEAHYTSTYMPPAVSSTPITQAVVNSNIPPGAQTLTYSLPQPSLAPLIQTPYIQKLYAPILTVQQPPTPAQKPMYISPTDMKAFNLRNSKYLAGYNIF